jgi:glycosyltransferase involved in cell wall biosynthesis
MKAKILVNARSFGRRVTGVERYAREVTARLGNRIDLVGTSATQGFGGHCWEQIALPRRMNKGTILWSPANSGPLAVSDQVVTIHDLSVIDHPEWFERCFAAWYRFLLPRLAQRASVVITDSNYSKIRIQEGFRISEEKIIVAPCGVDVEKFRPQSESRHDLVRRKYALPKVYALYVGTLEPRKNLRRLLNAWAQVEEEIQPLELVIAGVSGRPFQKSQDHGSSVKRIQFVGYVADEDLPALYSGARMYILPSLYEGFGLTAIEAMACGTPVIASDTTAIPEVVAEAGLCVSPWDEAALGLAIVTLWRETGLSEELAGRGLRRMRTFTWEKTAALVEQAFDLARAKQ